jgi:hypothetical protein
MSIHSDSHEPRAGTYPPFGDNLEEKPSEEDGVDQRAEPPSWLPDEARPGTGATADLHSPEGEEATTGASDNGTEHTFTGQSSYPNGEDTTYVQGATFGHGGTVVGGYSYVEDDSSYDQGDSPYEQGDSPASPSEETAQVPPYPAATISEPATAAAAVTPDLPAAGSAGSMGNTANVSGRTSRFSVRSRNRYRAGAGAAAAGPLVGPAAAGIGGASGAAAKSAAGSQAQARRADLVVARLEPWSVMKFSFLMSLVAWVVLFVAVALLYFVLSGLGVFDSIQHTLSSVTSSSGSSGMKLNSWFSASRVLGYTMLLGAVNIILITALCTVGAMIYNLVTHLGGGIEVTLRETD